MEQQRKLHLDVYTDGSFDLPYGVYGGGLVILMEGLKEPMTMKCSGRDPQYAKMANVAGELLAAMQALNIAEKSGATSVKIHHDYIGIYNWTKEEGEKDYWRAKKVLSKAYLAYVKALRERGLKIEYKWTPGHSGIDGNVQADKLAREAVRECIASLAIS